MLRSLPLLVTTLAGCTFYITGSGTGDAGGSGSADSFIGPDLHVDDAASIDAPDGSVTPPLVDAAVDSAIPPFDAPPAPDAGATSTLFETMQIPCNGQVVTSAHIYQSSVMYRVRASGQCKVDELFGNDILADAEYQGTVLPRDKDSGVDTGIALYDTTLGFDKQPHWGAYTSTHVYEVTGPGFDVPVTVRYHDKSNGSYSNNSGSLTIEIFGP